MWRAGLDFIREATREAGRLDGGMSEAERVKQKGEKKRELVHTKKANYLPAWAFTRAIRKVVSQRTLSGSRGGGGFQRIVCQLVL